MKIFFDMFIYVSSVKKLVIYNCKLKLNSIYFYRYVFINNEKEVDIDAGI